MTQRFRLGGILLGALGLLLIVLTGCGGSADASSPSRSPAVSSAAVAPATDPVSVHIPAIGVDAPIEPLVVTEDGKLPPPSGHDVTGWWSQGPEPGEPGPAVVTGHVNSAEAGPSVFARLPELQPGDEIIIDRVDGSSVTFAVQRIETHPKDADQFPTEAVYGDTPGPELRLITCGGGYDPAAGRYLDNVIVWAMPV